MMLAKIDIEKSFDTIEWPAILATLLKMNFPHIWISWIQECLSSSFFSLIINGSHTSWFPSSRGIRQGDHISSLMFILVTRNLGAILNHALHLNMITWFNSNLHNNLTILCLLMIFSWLLGPCVNQLEILFFAWTYTQRFLVKSLTSQNLLFISLLSATKDLLFRFPDFSISRIISFLSTT